MNVTIYVHTKYTFQQDTFFGYVRVTMPLGL